jgi:hypothetical protein
MEYTLTTPVTVGDLSNPITVDKLEVASISMNFEPFYSDKGTAILSVVLVHRASGYKMNIVYQDASALEFWQSHSATLEADVFSMLMADGKLPAGTVSNSDAAESSSTPAA